MKTLKKDKKKRKKKERKKGTAIFMLSQNIYCQKIIITH